MTSVNNKRISSIILINLLLALVSLCKDILLAGYLGTSAQADAFLLAYFIIDTIGNNLLANALGGAVIPVLAGLYESGEDQRLNKLTRLVVIYSVAISTLIAFLIFGMRFGLLSWVGAGLGEPSRQLSVGLFTLLIPSLVVFPLINIGISIMQVHNRFNIPALAPVLFNTIYLIGLSYLLYFKTPLVIGVYSLALFIMIGQLVMLSMVWLPIFKYRLIALPTWNSIYNPLVRSSFDEVIKLRLWTASSDLITVWKSFLPYLITLLFPQIIYFIERYLASHLEIGSISGLNYAFRLVQFPLWVFIAAVSSVLFSMMAKLSATGNKQEFNRVLMNSIYFTSVFTIPFTIILFVLRVPIISILLQRGEFNSHSMAITANIMAGYTLTIIWQGFSVIWVRAALVEGKVFYAILAAAVSAVSTIGVDFILVPLVGAAGLGYGAAIGAIINFITLYMLFARFRQLRFSKLWRGLFKIVLANLPLLLVTVMFSQLWVRIAGIGTFSSKFGYVTVVIIVCLPVYWLGLRFFRVELFEKEM
jgi:murein biosynthesis integral membrane protein MurJ